MTRTTTRAARVLLAVVTAAVATGCGPGPASHRTAAPPGPPTQRPAARTTSAAAPAGPPSSFTVVATGDVLVHQGKSLVHGAEESGRAQGVAYDFGDSFAGVAPMIQAADLAICHLETPVAPPDGPFRGYPAFDVQPQIVTALAGAGYDTCSTASNHSMDAGFDGVARTLDTLDAAGIGHSGTARTEAESRTPHITDVHGVRVADISWTYGLNGFREPTGRPWAVDVFDPAGPDVSGVLAEARRAREAGADVVVASVHCCTEYVQEPTAVQVAVARALLASPDVDLVIGHHAHVVQPFERIGGKWVAYGLGNHLAEQDRGVIRTPELLVDSVIARFTFGRGADGHYAVTRAEALPAEIEPVGDGLGVVLTSPGDPSYQRVAEVVGRRGAVADGLVVDG